MRIAFVGLSSPTAYLYDHEREFTNKSAWPWSPILESPQGLATLFDEVWFLHPALCPATMMKLDFVRFLDEERSKVSVIKPILADSEHLYESKIEEILDSMNDLSPVRRLPEYSRVVEMVTGWPKHLNRRVDNHSLVFQFSNVQVGGNSMDARKLMIDFIILERLRESADEQIELVMNRFTESMLAQASATLPEVQIAGGIVVKRIPSVLGPEGPDMSRIYTLRDNAYLTDFRRKICQLARDQESDDLLEIVENVEREYKDYRNRVLLEKHHAAQLVESLSRNAASFLIELLIPIPGLTEAAAAIRDRQTRRMNWTAFISSIEAES
jgi:hypothetical protein